MADDRLVAAPDEAKANIDRYESELAASPGLQGIMSYARSWYGYRGADGTWRVAPSRFVGYVGNGAADYARLHRERDGRRTERALAAWFDTVEPGSATHEDMTEAVSRLFARYGRAPNKQVRMNAMRAALPERSGERRLDAPRARSAARITVNPAICGGRPTIRGMRIRVSDILEMLAAGAERQDILADYPYLEDEDISAALDYAAQSADHRIVTAA